MAITGSADVDLRREAGANLLLVARGASADAGVSDRQAGTTPRAASGNAIASAVAAGTRVEVVDFMPIEDGLEEVVAPYVDLAPRFPLPAAPSRRSTQVSAGRSIAAKSTPMTWAQRASCSFFSACTEPETSTPSLSTSTMRRSSARAADRDRSRGARGRDTYLHVVRYGRGAHPASGQQDYPRVQLAASLRDECRRLTIHHRS